MTTPTHPLTSADLNHLRRQAHYQAVTHDGVVAGEYLGIEAPHGDRAILLRQISGTKSVPITRLLAITRTHERARAA